MYHKKYFSNKPHVKSAKIAGSVAGTWWPHGDTAIYDTFTRMSQKWINNIPEVDWHGNNGSQIIPDAAAAAMQPAITAGMIFLTGTRSFRMVINVAITALGRKNSRLIVLVCSGLIPRTRVSHKISRLPPPDPIPARKPSMDEMTISVSHCIDT